MTTAQIEYTINKLENVYDFVDVGGPLRLCADWQGLIAALRALSAERSSLKDDEKDHGAGRAKIAERSSADNT